MIMKKTTLSLLIAILSVLALLLSACGSAGIAAKDEMSGASDNFYNGDFEYGMVEAEDAYIKEKPTVDTNSSDYAEKIIRDVNMYAETRDFDNAVAEIRRAVSSLGGYEESVSITGRSYHSGAAYCRTAKMTLRLPAAESRRLVNYLLDYTVGSTRKGTRKFPKIANWLTVEYNDDGSVKSIDPDIAEKAFANIIPIPLKTTDALKLCYSFELFIEDALLTGAWYSVEQYDSAKNDNMVFSYEINRKSEIFDDFIGAFKYLIEIEPGVKDILEAQNSRMLAIY
jgi:hypothetical protein